jgi:hypothetical protein
MQSAKGLLTAAIVCTVHSLAAQGIPLSRLSLPQISNPQALAIVQQSITKLGGQALWQQVGGVTAQATVSSPGTAPYQINWTDDWSTGSIRFRRDLVANGANSLSLIGTDAFQVRLFPGGNTVSLRHDNGIVALAEGYPAAALVLSLSPQYSCTFQLGNPSDPNIGPASTDADGVIVTELCPDRLYPNGRATLVWDFSKSDATPISVKLPIWGQMNYLLRTQTVSFTAFQNVDGRITPSQLQIRRVSSEIDQLTISGPTFVQSIPGATFQLPN